MLSRPAAAPLSGDFVSIITLEGLSTADNDPLGAGVQQCDIAKKFVRATKHTPNVNREGANQTE
jgi:hypothetical protein